jgi:hypothetical protein
MIGSHASVRGTDVKFAPWPISAPAWTTGRRPPEPAVRRAPRDRFIVYEDSCVVAFATPVREDAFVDCFDGGRVGAPAVAHERREWVPPCLLSDRSLWDDFCRLGFVRQIECRGAAGCVQFDTFDHQEIT